MPDNPIFMIGQLLGAVAVILGFLSFQMKKPRGILTLQIVTASVFSLHYLLIGALTAVALNLLAAMKCVCYYFRNRRGATERVTPLVFTLLIILTSILTWDGWYSAFIMIGLVISAISLAFADAQKIRFAMLIKSPCCLVYNAFALSVGGIVYECAVLVSSVIGIAKNGRRGNRGQI